MPPAASGSENPRDQTKSAGAKVGPKRTPRPEADADERGAGGTTSAADARPRPSTGRSGGNGAGGRTKSKSRSSSTETRAKRSPSPDDAENLDITWDAPPAERSGSGSPGATVPVVDDPTVVTGAPVPPEGADDPTPDEDRRQRRSDRRGDRPDRGDRADRPRRTERAQASEGKRRGRRVRRVIRRIDLWSVLKLAIVLYTCLYAAVMGTLAVLWGLAYSSGQIEKVQSFMSDVGMDNYRFYGDQMWRAAAMIGAIGVLAATVITVLTAALINVISEMTGGIRVVVIEEDPPPRRRPAD